MFYLNIFSYQENLEQNQKEDESVYVPHSHFDEDALDVAVREELGDLQTDSNKKCDQFMNEVGTELKFSLQHHLPSSVPISLTMDIALCAVADNLCPELPCITYIHCCLTLPDYL